MPVISIVNNSNYQVVAKKGLHKVIYQHFNGVESGFVISEEDLSNTSAVTVEFSFINAKSDTVTVILTAQKNQQINILLECNGMFVSSSRNFEFKVVAYRNKRSKGKKFKVESCSNSLMVFNKPDGANLFSYGLAEKAA